MGRKPKYATEEERLAARREAQRKYNESRRDKLREYYKKYDEKHREERIANWKRQNEKRKHLQELGKQYEAILKGSEKDPQKQ